MGHSRAEKVLTHQKIVTIAARRFREVGLEGISVADIMSEAGLTVGGFYRHFETREALVVEALTQAFADLDSWEEVARSNLGEAIRSYLSEGHRDDLPRSCALTSLVNDVSRSNEATREVFNQRLTRMLGLIEGLISTDMKSNRKEKAIVLLSACVGSLALSRAVPNPEFSRSILRSTANELIEMYCASNTTHKS
jgi:TetR/AcrR family transcriptional repressor of nem operon